MNYFYLKNLKYDRDELLSLAKSVDPLLWEKWTNPHGKTAPYTQVKYKNISNKLPIIDVVNQLNFPLDKEKIVILKYAPRAILRPHTDWVNSCAILMGLTETSHIEFWRRRVPETVPYTYPILADLEETHSVTNDSDEERYVLKIPTPESFYNIAAKLKDLYNG